MRIAVNTRLLLKGRLEGIGNYAHETLQRIAINNPKHEFIFFFDRPYSNEFIYAANVTPVIIPLKARHPFLFIIWFNYLLPRYLKKYKADVFLSPDGYLSLNTDVPQIPVFHDLNFEHRPKDIPFWARWHYKKFFPKFAHKAKHIIAVSHYTKQDIKETYKVSPAHISVAYNGVKSKFEPISNEEKALIQNYESKGNPYIIYVGSIHARKNVSSLVQAFDLYHKNNPGSNLHLVLAGAKMWKNSPLEKWISDTQYGDHIICTGRIEYEDLAKLLPAAEMLCNLSFFEGFGVPVIEAQQAGIPVICSNKTSLPEVAGDAAILVDPTDIAGVAKSIELLLNDNGLRKDLISKGLENCQRFDWDTTAKQVFAIIQQHGK